MPGCRRTILDAALARKRAQRGRGSRTRPFPALRTARLSPGAIAWMSRFHQRFVRAHAVNLATEIVARLGIFAEMWGCKACHAIIWQRFDQAADRVQPLC